MKKSFIVAFALTLALVASSGAADAQQTGDYCSSSSPTTLVLIDRTSRYDDSDRQNLAAGFDRIFAQVQPRERLVLRTISAGYGESRTVYDRCKPGCDPAETGLFGSCRRMRVEADLRSYRSDFVDHARQIVNTAEEEPHSDVLMTIAVSTQEYGAKGLRQLFVFSDMLENSKSYRWPAILSVAPGDFATRSVQLNAAPKVQGARVAVFGFGRDHSAQRLSLAPADRQRLLATWRAYFATGRPASVSIEQNLP